MFNNLQSDNKGKIGSVRKLIIYNADSFKSVRKYLKTDNAIDSDWVDSIDFKKGLFFGHFDNGQVSLSIQQNQRHNYDVAIGLNTTGLLIDFINSLESLPKNLACLIQLPIHSNNQYIVLGDINNPFRILQNELDTTSSFSSTPGQVIAIAGKMAYYLPLATISKDKFI